MHLYIQIYLHRYKEELLFINLYVVGTFYPNKNCLAWFIFIMSDYDCLGLRNTNSILEKNPNNMGKLQMNGFS